MIINGKVVELASRIAAGEKWEDLSILMQQVSIKELRSAIQEAGCLKMIREHGPTYYKGVFTCAGCSKSAIYRYIKRMRDCANRHNIDWNDPLIEKLLVPGIVERKLNGLC